MRRSLTANGEAEKNIQGSIDKATCIPVNVMPNTHADDKTVELRRVGGVNTPVGSRDPVYNFLCLVPT